MSASTKRIALTIEPDGIVAKSPGWRFEYSGGIIEAVTSIDGQKPLEVLTRFQSWVGIVGPTSYSAGARVELEAVIRDDGPREINPGTATLVAHKVLRAPPTRDVEFVEAPMDVKLDLRRGLLHNLTVLSVRDLPPPNCVPAMFWHLDAQTAPPLISALPVKSPDHPKPPSDHERIFRIQAIEYVFAALADRARARFAGQPAAKVFKFRSAVAYLSALMISIFRHWLHQEEEYPRWTPQSVLASGLADALERFSAGMLFLKRDHSLLDAQAASIFVTDGAPNSPAVLLFAEFALLAIEMGIDRDAWSALLPALVAGQTLYREAYGDPAKRLPYADYLKQHKVGPRWKTPPKLQRTRELAGKNMAELEGVFCSNLNEFFSEPFNLTGK